MVQFVFFGFIIRSFDKEGDVIIFLYSRVLLLTDFKSPGLIQGELRLFSSFPLMVSNGKQHCRFSSIHL